MAGQFYFTFCIDLHQILSLKESSKTDVIYAHNSTYYMRGIDIKWKRCENITHYFH